MLCNAIIIIQTPSKTPPNTNNKDMVSKDTRHDDYVMPGAAELLIDYNKKVAQLRETHPNLIVAGSLQELGALLQEHRLCTEDILGAFPWTMGSLRTSAAKNLPFIYISEKIRPLLIEEMQGMSVYAKRAKKLFSVNDLDRLFRDNLVSTAHTVCMPISLFVNDIEGFRRDFIAEKKQFLERRYRSRAIYDWESVKNHVPDDKLEQLAAIKTDMIEICEKQNKKDFYRTTPPGMAVKMPSKIIPKFLSLKEVAEANACASYTSTYQIAFRRGWVRHEFPTDFGRVVGYTAGPLIGTSQNWADYRIGATVMMLVPRAAALIGEKAIKEARFWNIPNKFIFRKWRPYNVDAYQPMTDMAFLEGLARGDALEKQ